MPAVASEEWKLTASSSPLRSGKICSSITTVKGGTIQSTTTAWMSPYSRGGDSSHERSGSNNNNNNNGVMILEGCRPPAATTARRFLRWISRLGQPPIDKSGTEQSLPALNEANFSCHVLAIAIKIKKKKKSPSLTSLNFKIK